LFFEGSSSIPQRHKHLACLLGLLFEPIDLAGKSAEVHDEREECLVTKSQCGQFKLALKLGESELFEPGLAQALENEKEKSFEECIADSFVLCKACPQQRLFDSRFNL